MKILRTPDARFVGLPDYPFAPHYIDVQDDHPFYACMVSLPGPISIAI